MLQRVLTVLGAASLAAGLLVASAPRSGDAAASKADRLAMVYRVNVNGTSIGRFQLTGAITGGRYMMRGEARFGLLNGLLFEWNGSTSSAGAVGQGEPRPTSYGFAYSGGGKNETLRITFQGQSVKQVSIKPAAVFPPGRVPVTQAQLSGALDPLSALFLVAKSNDRSGDPRVCDQNVPVFDGRQRFDLVLSFKRMVKVTEPAYTGPAVVCRVKYVPVSGHITGDKGTALLAASGDIEAWLVPVPNSAMYVPYYIQVPTFGGYATVTSLGLESHASGRTGKAAHPE